MKDVMGKMNNSEKNREVYQYAKKFLIEHLPEGLSESDLSKYFEGDSRESSSLSDVFIVFIKSAQEYQQMPNVIKFVERKGDIGEILFGFDSKRVAQLKEECLYKQFREKFEVTSKDSKMNSWYKWSCAIIDSAKFICCFDDFDDFKKFVKRFDYNTQSRMALPLLISNNQRNRICTCL